MASTFIVTSLLGLTVAQSTTLSLPFYGFDDQAVDASIVSANPSATTMVLACPSRTDQTECGLFPYMTLVYGPSTYHLDMGVGDAQAFTGTVDCNRGATVTCTESAGGSEANFPGSSTTTYEGTDIATLPVTITSGAEKLGSAQASVTGSASRSATSGESASSGRSASATTASVTQIVGTNSAPASSNGFASASASAPATPSTGAASSNVAYLQSGLVPVVAAALFL